ncbi:MAG: hypothetical protein U0166_03785 [Acidobacteriota bacterium]
MSRALRVVATMAIASIATSWASFAQEVRVNEALFYAQNYPDIDAADRFVVGWTGTNPVCGVNNDLPQLRYLAAVGDFLTPQVDASGCTVITQGAKTALLPSGVSLMVLEENDQVTGRLFDTAGAPLTGWFQISADPPVAARYPTIAVLGPDRFVVVWQNMNEVSVYGTVVLADGTQPQPQKLLQSTPPNPFPQVAVLGNGHVVVPWYNSSTMELRAAIYDSQLNALGPVVVVADPSKQSGYYAVDAGMSTYAIAWQAGTSPVEVFLRVLDEAGAVTQPIDVSGPTSEIEGIVGLGVGTDGSGAVVWNVNGDTTLKGRRFDPMGVLLGPPALFAINNYSAKARPTIGMMSNGDFVAAWENSPCTTGNNVCIDMRRFFFPVSLALGPGPGAANAPQAVTVRPDGRAGFGTFTPYGAGGFGCNVASGDVENDGLDEILTGPGPSAVYGPHVRGFERDGVPIAKVSYFAYGTLRYGVRPASGGLDADPSLEILTGPGPGAVFGPHVRGWNYDGQTLTALSKVSFYAFGTLKYGAGTVGGDVDGDGFAEILAAPGPGNAFGAQVRGFNYDGQAVTAMGKLNYFAYPSPAAYGTSIAAADVESDGLGNYGDGFEEIAAARGPDPAGGPDVTIFDYDASSVVSKIGTLAPYGTLYGAKVAGGDADAGDVEEIATAPGPDPTATARILAWEYSPEVSQDPNAPYFVTIPTDDFTAFAGMDHGATIAIGTFE